MKLTERLKHHAEPRAGGDVPAECGSPSSRRPRTVTDRSARSRNARTRRCSPDSGAVRLLPRARSNCGAGTSCRSSTSSSRRNRPACRDRTQDARRRGQRRRARPRTDRAVPRDPTVTEVMVNAVQPIYVEREVGSTHPERAFLPRNTSGGSSNASSAGGPPHRRVVAMVTPVWPTVPRQSDHPSARDRRPALTVRKFAKHAFSVEDLIGFGTLRPSTRRSSPLRPRQGSTCSSAAARAPARRRC